MEELSPPNKYEFRFTCSDDRLHRRYYSCQNIETAIVQFKAGCEHKATQPEEVSIFECKPKDHVWTLIRSAPWELCFE